MPTTGSISFNDYDGQTGVVGFNFTEITPANFVDVATGLGDLRAKIEPVILGLPIKSELSIIGRFNASNARASDSSAQRGNKWRISYADDQAWLDPGTDSIPNPGFQKPFDIELPTADLSLRASNSDFVYSDGVGVTLAFESLVTSIENSCLSPYGGTVTVNFIKAVTRAGG